VALRKRVEGLGGKGSLKELRVLDLCMWTLKPSEVGQVLEACKAGEEGQGLQHLVVSVLMEDGWWEELVKAVEHNGAGGALEGLEIVGVPATVREEWEEGFLSDEKQVAELARVSKSLGRVEMSILKAKSVRGVVWVKKDGQWQMQEGA